MKLLLTRDLFGPDATLGVLRVEYDGELAYGVRGWQADGNRGPLDFGFTCEDPDRGLDAAMPLEDIQQRKVKSETAIPAGTYAVATTWSLRFQRFMPQLLDVPGFVGIRIHPGNNKSDTAGCILPGLTRDPAAWHVGRSAVACEWLHARIRECAQRGERVEVVIDRDPSYVGS